MSLRTLERLPSGEIRVRAADAHTASPPASDGSEPPSAFERAGSSLASVREESSSSGGGGGGGGGGGDNGAMGATPTTDAAAGGALLPSRGPESAPAEELDLSMFEPHVWKGCFICVIYLPKNMARCAETIANVISHGFPPPYMVPGVTPRPGDTVHDCVCRAHHVAVGFYLEKRLDTKYHLLVLEDDARFRFADAREKLGSVLSQLEAWGRWGSLHVGHIAMGPIYPVGVHGLCRTSNPGTSHCYVLNRRIARSLYAAVPEKLWKRPLMVEGHWALPPDMRFALAPPLCTQCVMPKEMASLPIIRDLWTFEDGEYFMMYMGYTLSAVGLLGLLWACVSMARWPLQAMRRAEAALDEDDMPPCELQRWQLSASLLSWLVATALLLHTVTYTVRRFTCSWKERRSWHTFLLDEAKICLGLATAMAVDFRYAHRLPEVEAVTSDSLAHAAAVLLCVPVLAWPLALLLRAAVAHFAAGHRRLQAIAVSGRYADSLSLARAALPGGGAGAPAAEAEEPPQTILHALAMLPTLQLRAQRSDAALLGSPSAHSHSHHAAAAAGAADGGEGGGAPLSPRTPPAPRTPAPADLDESAEEVAARLEAVVAAADAPERLQSLPPRISWWLAQTGVWLGCVGLANGLALGVLRLCQLLLGPHAPTALVGSAIARLEWSCSYKMLLFFGLGQLAVILAAVGVVDNYTKYAIFAIPPPRPVADAREVDRLAGRGLAGIARNMSFHNLRGGGVRRSASRHALSPLALGGGAGAKSDGGALELV